MDWSLSFDAARERLKEAWDEGKKTLDDAGAAVTRLASEAEHAAADAEARAIDAAGALADKIADKLADHTDAPLVKAALQRARDGAAVLADHARNGGVARLAEDAGRVVTLANQGTADTLRPLVAPLREVALAGEALAAGDTRAALAHVTNVANAAGHIGAPVEVAAYEAYRRAEKTGESPPLAAWKAARDEMLDQANGLNPLYNVGVAGVEAHEGADKLLLENDPRAFFAHVTKGSIFFASAVAGVVGLDEASAGTEALGNVARTTASELETSSLTSVERLAMADALAPAEAERLKAAYAKIVDELRVVNPGSEREAGRLQNCVNCGLAGTATLKGNPATALPGGPVEAGELAKVYGTRMERMPSLLAIETKMRASGDGALGLVFIDPHDPDALAHIVHAANRDGLVLFADSQLDTPARFPDKANLWLLMVP
jgi:papain fold toxin 1 (glutamine deamidase) of polymorphic toxin system